MTIQPSTVDEGYNKQHSNKDLEEHYDNPGEDTVFYYGVEVMGIAGPRLLGKERINADDAA